MENLARNCDFFFCAIKLSVAHLNAGKVDLSGGLDIMLIDYTKQSFHVGFHCFM